MNRNPTFFWQGMLIVLPVLALAAAGGVSLWQDRETVTLEARRAAGQFAEPLAAFLEEELGEALRAENERVFPERNRESDVAQVWTRGNRIDQQGNLVRVGPHGGPGDFPRVPLSGAFPRQRLDAGSAADWQEALAAEYADPGAAMEAYRRFLEGEPPEPFRANARYALAVLLAGSGRNDDAMEVLESLAGVPEVTESGLPLAVLVDLQRVKGYAAALRGGEEEVRAPLRTAADDLGRRALQRASVATISVLQAAEDALRGLDAEATERIRSAIAAWRTDEITRGFFQSSGPFVSGDPEVRGATWREWNGEVWLVATTPYDGGEAGVNGSGNGLYSVHLFSEPVVREALDRLLALPRSRPPDSMGMTVHLDGRSLADSPMEGELLATVERAWRVDGAPAGEMAVVIRLLDPDRLYALQRQRALWFGALILIAAATALIGFVAVRRAFLRQLALSEMKSNFVASVSHELRAPIASVRLMAEGLERGTVREPEKQRGYYRFIVQECRRLSSLIENVLDFSRIEQGRKQYQREPADMEELVRHTVDLMTPSAREHRVTLETEIDPAFAAGLPQPEIDGKAIQQALVNLIDNAIKHSPPNAGVRVGLLDGDAAGLLRLFVEDQGAGIPAEEHERIFERFYRCGSELRRNTRGAGIGLSIVKHIVEAHDGKILVHSTPGQGSRFTIELPYGANTHS